MNINTFISLVTAAIIQGKSDITFGSSVIMLPSPQRSGSMGQQRLYAQMKATDIANGIGVQCIATLKAA
jgi:hypothetical protein